MTDDFTLTLIEISVTTIFSAMPPTGLVDSRKATSTQPTVVSTESIHKR
jgi:hypothetical protein